jgi:hypothetical protein
MWTLKLLLATLWMAGMMTGSTFGGWLHLFALAAVALVLIEETPLERRVRRFRFRARHAH